MSGVFVCVLHGRRLSSRSVGVLIMRGGGRPGVPPSGTRCGGLLSAFRSASSACCVRRRRGDKETVPRTWTRKPSHVFSSAQPVGWCKRPSPAVHPNGRNAYADRDPCRSRWRIVRSSRCSCGGFVRPHRCCRRFGPHPRSFLSPTTSLQREGMLAGTPFRSTLCVESTVPTLRESAGCRWREKTLAASRRGD